MTSKSKTSSRAARIFFLTSSQTARPSLLDVIPDGPQGRAGIQTGAPPMPAPPAWTTCEASRHNRKSLDPGFRLRRPRDDIKRQNVLPGRHALLYLSSSRTARRAEPGSRRALHKCCWIPASAGMTAKEVGTLFLPSSHTPPPSFLSSSQPARTPYFSSSRTARRAEPGSSPRPQPRAMSCPCAKGFCCDRKISISAHGRFRGDQAPILSASLRGSWRRSAWHALAACTALTRVGGSRCLLHVPRWSHRRWR